MRFSAPFTRAKSTLGAPAVLRRRARDRAAAGRRVALRDARAVVFFFFAMGEDANIRATRHHDKTRSVMNHRLRLSAAGVFALFVAAPLALTSSAQSPAAPRMKAEK